MAKASTSEVFNCSCEEFYKIVSDYEKYPEFLAEVKSVKILKADGVKKSVEYSVSVMKSFKYTLAMVEKPNESISWEFASGDIFKTMSGGWKFENQAGKCKATYTVEATFGVFVPSPIANALVSVNLPNMMSSYHKRVKQIYGK